MSIEELVSAGVAAGATAMALTDINASTGVYDFLKACKPAGIKPMVGIEFWDEGMKYIGIARDKEGFRELNEVLTRKNLKKEKLPERLQLEHAYTIYPFGTTLTDPTDHEFIGVEVTDLNKLHLQRDFSRYVMLHSITLATKADFGFHQVLRSIDNNTLLSKINQFPICRDHHRFFSNDKVLNAYSKYPALIRNTEALIANCHFEFDFSTPKNKKYFTGSKQSDKNLLASLAHEGLIKRYGNNHKEAQERVKREIEVIDQLGFAGYFLITWDIVRYSQYRGFYHVGRGSGANSVVSYCLGITNICPIELNLYFERFLNTSRKTPPDFDIDWSWKDRDEILDYIFKRFDDRCTAFTGTIAQFKYRSTIREVGKALGLPKEELDLLSKKQPSPDDFKDPVIKQVLTISERLKGFPNQRSVHSCGVIISEEPLTYYTALDMPPKGFPTAQFDMYIGEDIGFEKFDILSQRGIGHINDCVELIKENQGEEIDIHDTESFKTDPAINAKLAKGETLGCFYIESPAMRGLLRRLKCDNYPVLVAASSVIRPGVAKSGMMSEYIRRHNNPDNFEFFHPAFEKHLGETYGIMVYQEDVIKIAHGFANLSPTDGDVLRRAMSGKTRSIKELDKVKQKFLDNCRELGHPDELTREVYRQIESFAGYSFCKAHSASYAVESYQSLYLKTYYPIEFMVAVINNFGGFYRTEVYVHEARMAGAAVYAPCINRSMQLTTLYGKDIYLGFIHVQGLEQSLVASILHNRQQDGAFTSMDDFIERISVGIEQLQTLIYIGAFRFTGKTKSQLIIGARMQLTHRPSHTTSKLFSEPKKDFTLPTMERTNIEDAFDEIEILGFPVSVAPFDMLKTAFRGNVMVSSLSNLEGSVVRMLGYLISQKPVPTSRGLMYFGTWVDVKGNYFDTTHFPDNLQKYPFTGGGCYLLLGRVVVDYHFPSLEILKMAKLPYRADPRYGAPDKERPRKIGTNDIDPWIPQRPPYQKYGNTLGNSL